MDAFVQIHHLDWYAYMDLVWFCSRPIPFYATDHRGFSFPVYTRSKEA